LKSARTFIAVVGTLALACGGCVGVPTNAPMASSPADAIELVLSTRQADILAVDSPESWWHDTKRRDWSVSRPFEPGALDTSHTFVVSYSIDGVVVAEWDVDTRAATAIRRERPY
jgi:hypothetical protein